jgi:hypothetical protein
MMSGRTVRMVRKFCWRPTITGDGKRVWFRWVYVTQIWQEMNWDLQEWVDLEVCSYSESRAGR